MRRGLTLIELMITLALMAIIAAAVASAYASGFAFNKHSNESRDQIDRKFRFEDRLRDLLRGAYISAAPNAEDTFFLGQSTGSNSEGTADTLTFTTTSSGTASAVLDSEDEFETLNERFGPQGGVSEISLSTTAVGSPGNRQGLFIREQRPSDGDATQGGSESVLNEEIETISFEFFDGSSWNPTWDTTTMQPKRLPAAVRASYTFRGEGTSQPHVILVKLPNSDVSAQNPITEGAATP